MAALHLARLPLHEAAQDKPTRLQTVSVALLLITADTVRFLLSLSSVRTLGLGAPGHQTANEVGLLMAPHARLVALGSPRSPSETLGHHNVVLYQCFWRHARAWTALPSVPTPAHPT